MKASGKKESGGGGGSFELPFIGKVELPFGLGDGGGGGGGGKLKELLDKAADVAGVEWKD